MNKEYHTKQEQPLTRREREKKRQRAEILNTALDLFSIKGYHNVTMHEIAEKAEFAVGTLYKFFKNKEDLYKALVLGENQQFHDTVVAALEEHEDEMEKLRNYIKIKSDNFQSHLPMIRLYFSEIYGESYNLMAELNNRIKETHEEHIKIIASIFESGIRKKQFKRIADPYTLAIAFDGITSALFFRWLEDPEEKPFQEDPDVILNIFLRGLVD